MRRLMLEMSQEKLGEKLGLTFQQVQKYEKGTYRILARAGSSTSLKYSGARWPGRQAGRRRIVKSSGRRLRLGFSVELRWPGVDEGLYEHQGLQVAPWVVDLVEEIAGDQR